MIATLYKPMNQVVKAAWVKALRSGEYLQTTGRLRREQEGKPHYCCLGVLCDISGLGQWTPNRGNGYTTTELEDFATLPHRVQEWAELSPDVRGELVGMNDASQETFNTIADFIEENL